MHLRRRVLLLPLVTLLGACTSPATAVVVAASSEAPVPAEVATVRLTITRGGVTKFDASAPAAFTLPGTLTLVASDDAPVGEPMTIQLVGTRPDGVTVRREAKLAFASEHTKLLRMRLERSCFGLPCEPGKSTCVHGTCVPIDVDVDTLPEFTSNEDAVSDSGAAGHAAGGSSGGGQGGTSGKGGAGGAGATGGGGTGGAGGAGKGGAGGAGQAGMGGAGQAGIGGAGQAGASGKGGAGGAGQAGIGGQAGAGGAGQAGIGGQAGAGGAGQAGIGGQGGAGGAGQAGIGGQAGAGGAGQAGIGGAAGQAGIGGGGQAGAAGGQVLAGPHTIASGADFACALGTADAGYCWGLNDGGQLGTGETSFIVPAPSALSGPALSAIVGSTHACGIGAADKALYCWRGTGAEVSGDGTGTLLYPGPIAAAGAIDEVTVAYNATCFRKGGSVSCFGRPDSGLFPGAPAGVPITATGIDDALALSTGGPDVCAIRTGVAGGTRVTCWGPNLSPPVDLPGETDAVQVASYTGWIVVRRSDGTLHAAQAAGGSLPAAQPVPKAPQVDTFAYLTALCGVRSQDKHVLCRIGGTPLDNTDFSDVAGLPAGDPTVELATGSSAADVQTHVTCARSLSGKVSCWGNDRFGMVGGGMLGASLSPFPVPGLPGAAIDVATTVSGTIAVLATGDARTWGGLRAFGYDHQSGNFASVPTAIAGAPASSATAVAGREDAQAYFIGGGILTGIEYGVKQTTQRLLGAPGSPAFVQAVTFDHVDVALVDTGASAKVQFFLENPSDAALGSFGIFANGAMPAGTAYPTVSVPGAKGIAVAPVQNRVLAWDGTTLSCWGDNYGGSCAQPVSNQVVMSPTAVAVPGSVVSACTGWDHGCAVTSGGQVYCWGLDDGKDLGGAPGTPHVPAPKSVPATMTRVACSDFGVCAYGPSDVYCWGRNDFGQLGMGDRNDRSSPTALPIGGASAMSITVEHSCAVTGSGAVQCWGSPWGGALGNGATGYHVDATLVPVP